MAEKRFTHEEAQRIFAAAAERQRAQEASRQDTLTLGELEEAALAAGLDPALVRAAALDEMHPDRLPVDRGVMGFPTEIRRVRSFGHPLDDPTWARLVDQFRRTFDKTGIASEVGGVREWATHVEDAKMPIRITAEPEEGGTRLTVQRQMHQQALGLGIGSGVLFGMAVLFLLIWLFATGPQVADMIKVSGLMALMGTLFFGVALAGTRREAQTLRRQFRDVLQQSEQVLTSSQDAQRRAASERRLEAPQGDAAGPARADEPVDLLRPREPGRRARG